MSEVYHLDHDDLFCKFCKKECKNRNSLAQHEIRCKENPNRKNFNCLGKYSHENLKGKTKETCKSVLKQSETLKNIFKTNFEYKQNVLSKFSFKGRHHTKETREKMSNTRKQKIASGDITLSIGTSRGKSSFIIYGDKKYLCRSTYEFIFALYLLDNNIHFEMEDTRVPAIENPYNRKTFVSDFRIGNIIIEVKGIKSDKEYYVRESFERLNYEFYIIYKPEIMLYKNYLINKGYDMINLLYKIKVGNDNKNYFVYYY